jgi:hypothetical protein
MATVSRPLRLALGACGLALMISTGCAGSAPRTPTVASVNLEPTAELHVGDTGQLTFMLHEVTAAASVPAGSVLLIANDGQADHRIQAGSTFDTGTLHPGDETTVVLTAGDLTLRDVPTGREVRLTVTPRP